MFKKIILPILFICLVGCATTPAKPDVNATAGKVLEKATTINNITGALMRGIGPFAVTGLCVVQPEYCGPAKSAYSLALAAQKEYTALLQSATEAQQAPDGLKLATLAATFKQHFEEVNKIIVQAGGADQSKTLQDLQDNLSDLQAISK